MKKRPVEDDSGLVEACIKGDLAAWSALAQKYYALVYLAIEKRLKKYGFTLPRQDIEDIRQNVLASIWRDGKLRNVKNRKDISFWLAIVAGNAAMEHMRHKHAAEVPAAVSFSDKCAGEELIALVPSAEPDPADRSARNEAERMINAAVRSLPPREKLIMKLNIYHDKKYHEIAEILNMPVGTVSSHIKRARERLRKKLKYLQ